MIEQVATDTVPDTDRRDFLRNLVGAAGMASVAVVPGVTKLKSIPLDIIQAAAPTMTPTAVTANGFEEPLERMRAELGRAMAKPQDQRRWVMVIDLRKCVGCSSCTISCVAENHLPPASCTGLYWKKKSAHSPM